MQQYPQTRLLVILVDEVVYNQNQNDAQLASLSVLSYSRWRPRWRPCIKTCVFSQVYVRFYIVIHVFGCFRKHLIHLELLQSNPSPFSASKVRHYHNWVYNCYPRKANNKKTLYILYIGQFELLLYIIYCSSYFAKVTIVDTHSLDS